MSQKKFGDAVKEKLRDPIWQSIGVVITVLGLILTFSLGTPAPESVGPPPSGGPKKIMIYPAGVKSLTDFPESLNAQISLMINGREETDVRLSTYFVEYKGSTAVRKNDFDGPIRGSVPQGRKILAIQQSRDQAGPIRLDERGEIIADEKPAPMPFEIETKDPHNFAIGPMMMNPGDWFKIDVYTAADVPNIKPGGGALASRPAVRSSRIGSLAPEVSWHCRVAEAECPARFELAPDRSDASPSPWYLSYRIAHHGWAIYFIVLFMLLNLILFMILAMNARVTQSVSFKQILVLSLAVVSSLAVAEILADWLFNNKGLNRQPVISSLGIAFHTLLLVLLAIPIVLRKLRLRQSAPGTSTP